MRNQPSPVGQILRSVVKSRGWEERVARERALLIWKDIVGEVTANHAHADRIENGILFVRTDSPSWSHTLSLMKADLLECYRKKAPEVKLKDIRFLCAGAERPKGFYVRNRKQPHRDNLNR